MIPTAPATGPAVSHVGFNSGRFGGLGDLSALDRALGEQIDIGATVCELTATGLCAVSSCRLIPERVTALQAVLRGRAIRYTLHAPIAINLMDEPHLALHRRAAETSLELAAACGADTIVLHPGRVAPTLWVDQSRRLLQLERDVLGPLGDKAQALGLRIAYENISPNPWVLAGEETSYSLDLVQLADQLAALGHRAVVACLDVSHAQQGAVLQGFDLVAQARALSPHIGHIHFSDSTGAPATMRTKEEGERIFFGVGDMHAAPGHGALDFEGLLGALSVQTGTAAIIELKPTFYALHRVETLAAAKAFAARVEPVA